MTPRSVLFTGGCRSGKSELAQRWAESMKQRRAYVATARGFSVTADSQDAEMTDRVLRHRAVRGDSWFTVEPDDVSPDAPLDAVAALQLAVAAGAEVILFDCVTLWLADQLMHDADPPLLQHRLDALATCVSTLPVPLALVTNELGSGLVPDNAPSRQFRDMAGLANQRLGQICDSVVLAVCGQPLVVKSPGMTLPPWLGL